HYAQSRTFYHAARDAEGEAGASLSLAALTARTGDLDAARAAYEAGLHMARAAEGEPWAAPVAARALHGLGSLANRQGDYAAALDHAQQSLAIARALRD